MEEEICPTCGDELEACDCPLHDGVHPAYVKKAVLSVREMSKLKRTEEDLRMKNKNW